MAAETEKKSIFIISSFHPKYHNVIELAMKPAIEDANFRATIADGSESGHEEIYTDMSEKLYEAEMCIADVSVKYDKKGNKINLENVYYEISAAHAIGKHMILLSTNPEELPYNIKNQRTIKYDEDDLKTLREDILAKILQLQSEFPYKRFKKLEFLTPELKRELDTLRLKSTEISLSITPPTADIFLNDVLLNKNECIRVNRGIRNTVSIAAPAYYEEHIVLNEEHYDSKELKIILQKVPDLSSKNKQNKEVLLGDNRLFKWLANRRKDPANPVLMRAIAQFLIRLAKNTDNESEKAQYREDAKKELDELLKVAPGWYMAHNQVGIFYQDDYEKSIQHYKIATALNPKNYLGYYNQACSQARQEAYDKVFDLLQVFLDSEEILKSYSYSNMRLGTDEAFQKLKEDEERKIRFDKLVNHINNKAKLYREG